MEAVGLPMVAFWSSSEAPPRVPMHLLEIADFVSPGDPRLDRLVERLGPAGQRARPIGGFAMPIVVSA